MYKILREMDYMLIIVNELRYVGAFYYLRGFRLFLCEQPNDFHNKRYSKRTINSCYTFSVFEILHVKSVFLESLQVRIVERYVLH